MLAPPPPLLLLLLMLLQLLLLLQQLVGLLPWLPVTDRDTHPATTPCVPHRIYDAAVAQEVPVTPQDGFFRAIGSGPVISSIALDLKQVCSRA
jgi:hypothetical protein